jgi:hypothetical protein
MPSGLDQLCGEEKHFGFKKGCVKIFPTLRDTDRTSKEHTRNAPDQPF